MYTRRLYTHCTYLNHRRLRILWRACAVARLWWVWAAAPGSRRSYCGDGGGVGGAPSDPYCRRRCLLKRIARRRHHHRRRRPSGSYCARTTARGVRRHRTPSRRRCPAESSNMPYLVIDGTNWLIRDGCTASDHAGTRSWASGPSSVWPLSFPPRSRHHLLNTHMLHMYKRAAPHACTHASSPPPPPSPSPHTHTISPPAPPSKSLYNNKRP